MSRTIIRNVGLVSGRGDIAISDGSIVADLPAGAVEVDGSGLVAIPRLTDSHLHLDKTLLGERWYPHRAGGTIPERVRLEIETLRSPEMEETFVRAARLLHAAVSNGSTCLRSHVDISATLGLSRLQALMELREAYTDVVDITFVAFPQEGILTSPGTEKLLVEALEMGVEAIGGLDPADWDDDRDGHLDVVFGLAERYGCRIDIHLHEPGEIGAATMREIAARTRALGLQGRVAISHGYALGMLGGRALEQTAGDLAEAGVSLITNVPGAEARPPVGVLIDLGMNVIFASDNVRDSWSPFGKADMLERVGLAGYLFGWNTDELLLRGLDCVTRAPSAALGDAPALLRPGDAADFLLVRAHSVQEAIVRQPRERIVYRRGRVVSPMEGMAVDEAVTAS